MVQRVCLKLSRKLHESKTENISIREARKLYKSRFPSNNISFSEVVRKSGNQVDNPIFINPENKPKVHSENSQQLDTQCATTSSMKTGLILDSKSGTCTMEYQAAKISRHLSQDTNELDEYSNDAKRMVVNHPRVVIV